MVSHEFKVGDRVYIRQYNFYGTISAIHEGTFVSVVRDDGLNCDDNSPYYIGLLESVESNSAIIKLS